MKFGVANWRELISQVQLLRKMLLSEKWTFDPWQLYYQFETPKRVEMSNKSHIQKLDFKPIMIDIKFVPFELIFISELKFKVNSKLNTKTAQDKDNNAPDGN